MLTDARAALDVANAIIDASRDEDRRLARVAEYLSGTYPPKAYIPQNPGSRAAQAEYLGILNRSRMPVLSLVVDSLAQNLFVDGYRPARSAENMPSWDHWQANRMDARQAGLHHAAIGYGAAYLVILPGDPVPVWRPVSARRMRTVFADRFGDEWPTFALEVWSQGSANGSIRRFRLYDDTSVWDMACEANSPMHPASEVLAVREHGTGFCPVVRYVGDMDLDGEVVGEVEPLIPLQDQIDATTFNLEMAQQYAVHRQRWVTGMAVPEDDNGKPIEPFRAAVDRLWVAEDPDTRFGEFAQTDIKSWLDARDKALRAIAIKSQTPPGYLLGEMANLSAEALAATEAPAQRRASSYRTSFGESHEQAFRLDALQSGDEDGWADLSAQVVWRDTESRSLAQVADALGKLAASLGIPPRGLWEKIPGVTDQDLSAWDELASRQAQESARLSALSFGVDVNSPLPAPAA